MQRERQAKELQVDAEIQKRMQAEEINEEEYEPVSQGHKTEKPAKTSKQS